MREVAHALSAAVELHRPSAEVNEDDATTSAADGDDDGNGDGDGEDGNKGAHEIKKSRRDDSKRRRGRWQEENKTRRQQRASSLSAAVPTQKSKRATKRHTRQCDNARGQYPDDEGV
jgi:hypothetical protein